MNAQQQQSEYRRSERGPDQDRDIYTTIVAVNRANAHTDARDTGNSYNI